MAKNIADYLHLYFKQWGEVSESKVDEYQNGKWALSAKILHHALMGDLKFTPHLRPLPDMTRGEAEFINCGSIMPDDELKQFDYYNEFADGCPAYQYLKYEDYGGSSNTLSDQMGNPVSWDFLLKHGFDLFGLIEAGLAVDKTKEGK